MLMFASPTRKQDRGSGFARDLLGIFGRCGESRVSICFCLPGRRVGWVCPSVETMIGPKATAAPRASNDSRPRSTHKTPESSRLLQLTSRRVAVVGRSRRAGRHRAQPGGRQAKAWPKALKSWASDPQKIQLRPGGANSKFGHNLTQNREVSHLCQVVAAYFAVFFNRKLVVSQNRAVADKQGPPLHLWLTSLSEISEHWTHPIGQAGAASWTHIRIRQPRSTMSCVPVVDDGAEVCANCGKQGSDAVKLKNCTACRLVKYCGVDCQRAHRKQHKQACKQRAAELKDEQLYGQGHERPEGDFCPICTLPIPLSMENHSFFKYCCMKLICHGCGLAAQKRGLWDCPFCRTPYPDNDADKLAMIRARVKKKDPAATYHLGGYYCHGRLGLQKDMQKAVELWTEAAELGWIEALYNLGIAYESGEGVEKNRAKAAEFYKKAAMQGHVQSRYNLGCYVWEKMNHDCAVKHWLISAKMGHENSLENIKRAFGGGLTMKEQYVEALRGYQDAVEEMRSNDRDEAKRLRDGRCSNSTNLSNLPALFLDLRTQDRGDPCGRRMIRFPHCHLADDDRLGERHSPPEAKGERVGRDRPARRGAMDGRC
ncbi:hypothetical protein THAOC_33352, partial [Thalassiosira oceanica]